jgi:hypothetical protein
MSVVTGRHGALRKINAQHLGLPSPSTQQMTGFANPRL